MLEPERIDRRRAALIAYDVCRRALAPSDPARRATVRPVLGAWIQLIAVARAAGVPVIYTTPVSRADGADVAMLPTDLSADTGVPPLTNVVEATAEAGFPEEIAPRPEDYVFLKRRPSAFYGTGVAELLHMRRRDTAIIRRRHRRPRLQPRQGDENVRAHPAPRSDRGHAAGMTCHLPVGLWRHSRAPLTTRMVTSRHRLAAAPIGSTLATEQWRCGTSSFSSTGQTSTSLLCSVGRSATPVGSGRRPQPEGSSSSQRSRSTARARITIVLKEESARPCSTSSTNSRGTPARS
ncbi:MAG: maleamate amidohydrolase [Acetobacteraceae bacterium]|jgi:hypothetical protein|nr:maleamate amidohydrolase [Acetobacteraceae bacterium]